MTTGIVLSANDAHGKYLPILLAKKLEKNGIPVLLTEVCWPRDEPLFFTDGSYDYVQKATVQTETSPHFAWNGGTFLKGNNFILSSLTANPVEKQAKTHQVLGVEKGFYFDIEEELDELNEIQVSGRSDFYKSDFPHIDAIYNIGNTSQSLFTYEHPALIRKGEEMSDLCGYSLETIPLEEVKFASVGFIEVDDKIVLDRRAKRTKKLLERIGYEVITTPFGLKKTNRRTGSLRCITTEMPLDCNRIKKVHPNKATYEERFVVDYALLFNRLGEKVISDKMKYQLVFN